ncbi:hypothetical protein [Glaciecola petra]|uniref:Uncharacterized protein n=1 Tax=Glaciecola petra TaxID=3075602 RepID=A0ABU2ZNQ0_9ALTE|nr:hypothetical protein [Aestuariibacter sp. P117]MDT0594235.1 hypothetical protein [Aestuariibacter sp. P117]
MLIAVETGDLVASTSLSEKQLAKALLALKTNFEKITANEHGSYEIFRGDAYQIVYFSPKFAFKYAVLTKLFLLSQLDIKVNVSQSIAIDVVNSQISKPSENMHSVLVTSGRQLDRGNKGEILLSSDLITDDFSLANAFLNRLINSLTQKQAEALYWYIRLDYPEQQRIADTLKMTRQNVNTHLNRASADLVKNFLYRFEHNIEQVNTNEAYLKAREN